MYGPTLVNLEAAGAGETAVSCLFAIVKEDKKRKEEERGAKERRTAAANSLSSQTVQSQKQTKTHKHNHETLAFLKNTPHSKCSGCFRKEYDVESVTRG